MVFGTRYGNAQAVAAFPAEAVLFDGTNDYLTKTGGLDGSPSDNKLFTFSVWVRLAAAQTNFIFTGDSSDALEILTLNQGGGNTNISVKLYNSSSTLIMEADMDTTVISDALWHHVALSCDLSNSAEREMYFDGVDATPDWITYTDDTIEWSDPGTFVVGATPAGGNKFNGEMAELYVANQRIDLDTNIGKYISGGKPVSLGADGSAPTGTIPLVYQANPLATWHTNLGSGGGFTENGALTQGDTPVEVGG